MNQKRAAWTLLAAAGLAPLAGCATVVHAGWNQAVTVTSKPSGATITDLPSGKTVVTPGQMRLKRNRTHTLTARLAGHADAAQTIKTRPSWWVLGNVLIGGLIGICIDMIGGGGFTLKADEAHFDLPVLAGADAPTSGTATVATP